MRKFLVKCTVFCILTLVVLLSQKILDYVTPWYWGYDDLYVKQEFLHQEHASYDVVFFGSSRSFRNINPAVFDSITGLKSFNAALPGTRPPELYMVVEDLIALKNDERPQTFFVELIDLHPALIKEDMSVRRNYWMTAKNYSFGMRNFAEKKAVRTMLRYTEGFIQAQTKFGMGRKQYQSIYKERDERFALGPKQNGHLSFVEQLELGINNESIEERQKGFSSDMPELIKRRHLIISEIQENRGLPHQVHLDKINSLISLAAEKNIDLIFFRGPIQERAWVLLNDIPEGHKIDLGNPLTRPEFYQPEYHFDHGHLSEEGAKLFSLALTEELRKLTN